jgi:hypothetical protein
MNFSKKFRTKLDYRCLALWNSSSYFRIIFYFWEIILQVRFSLLPLWFIAGNVMTDVCEILII